MSSPAVRIVSPRFRISTTPCDRTRVVQPHFTPELFEFLSDLQANNNREWFADNKWRYEQHVKEPLLEFIEDFGPHLRSKWPW
ncbi:MAG: DUF2461 family protein [bacterium]|nr:DUF2461 family protein [bacterium]MCY3888888.1 DUF2461 family protein [bacterium]MCY3962275.1 DUF2461 family protein [bacterium]